VRQEGAIFRTDKVATGLTLKRTIFLRHRAPNKCMRHEFVHLEKYHYEKLMAVFYGMVFFMILDPMRVYVWGVLMAFGIYLLVRFENEASRHNYI